MNSRKITALLLSSAMALSVLTGCGGVNKDKTVAMIFIPHISEKMSGHPIYMEMERPGRIILKTA